MKPDLTALLGGGGKAKADDTADASPARTYAGEAYDALKDGDRDGFIEAILSAIGKSDPAEPDTDDEE